MEKCSHVTIVERKVEVSADTLSGWYEVTRWYCVNCGAHVKVWKGDAPRKLMLTASPEWYSKGRGE